MGIVTQFWSMRHKGNFAGKLLGKFICSLKEMYTEEMVIFLLLDASYLHKMRGPAAAILDQERNYSKLSLQENQLEKETRNLDVSW